MKTFISSEDFQRVLELLGLPGETMHIEIGGRARAENGYSGMVLTGVNSSWALKAVIAEPGSYDHERHSNLEPYSTRTVYVPVLLPNDWEGHLASAEPGATVDVPDWVFQEILPQRYGSVAAAEARFDIKITCETLLKGLTDFYRANPNHWSEHLTDAEVTASPVKACLPIPFPPVTGRPSSVPPETPLAAANPGTGAYGDGPYITPEERESIKLAPSPKLEVPSE